MKQDNIYIIHFGNLKEGGHNYDFDIDRHFLDEFPYSLVKNGHIKVDLLLDKEKETLLNLHFHFKGYIDVECDRCLDVFQYPIDSRAQIIVKLTDKEQSSEDDDLIYLPAEAGEMSIKPILYEYINLELPLKKACSLIGKDCNAAIEGYLAQKEEKNKDATEPDPRWARLKALKDNKL